MILNWSDETFWDSSLLFLFTQIDIYLKHNNKSNNNSKVNNNTTTDDEEGWHRLSVKPPGE